MEYIPLFQKYFVVQWVMPRNASGSLTAKQMRFVQEYVAHGNGTRAAIAAGYSAKTARAIACENLKKLEIKAEVEKRLKGRERKCELEASRAMEALGRIAFSDLSG